jgi:hypothetical protein
MECRAGFLRRLAEPGRVKKFEEELDVGRLLIGEIWHILDKRFKGGL